MTRYNDERAAWSRMRAEGDRADRMYLTATDLSEADPRVRPEPWLVTLNRERDGEDPGVIREWLTGTVDFSS